MPVPELTWIDEQRCRVGDASFRILPTLPEHRRTSGNSQYFLFKPKPLVERYAELVEKLRPRNIFELGVFEGGSTIFLSELAQPDRLVAVDWGAPNSEGLSEYLAGHERPETLRVFDDVDQADRRRLREIADDAFGSDPLDLVFDDCSHLYEPTRASFNELFPRLRPGGVFAIEDWRWAHAPLGAEDPEGMWPDEVPLTRLLFEITLAIPSYPDLIRDVRINLRTIEVTRGDAEIEPGSFDISGCCNARGRNLLAGLHDRRGDSGRNAEESR